MRAVTATATATLSLSLYIYIYIYAHISISLSLYIYIYISYQICIHISLSIYLSIYATASTTRRNAAKRSKTLLAAVLCLTLQIRRGRRKGRGLPTMHSPQNNNKVYRAGEPSVGWSRRICPSACKCPAWDPMERMRGTLEFPCTVSFHNFKSQNFKLSVSNPRSKYVACVSVLSRISNSQGLGRKNKLENLKTYRII